MVSSFDFVLMQFTNLYSPLSSCIRVVLTLFNRFICSSGGAMPVDEVFLFENSSGLSSSPSVFSEQDM